MFHMNKVLLFGATGNVGKSIARELKKQGYELTVVLRDSKKADQFAEIADNHIVANVSDPKSLENICNGFDVVVSALGKSVSPNDKSKASFQDIDYTVNSNILEDAVKNGVKKFIYISAFHAEKYLHLTYFKVHHDFSEKLKNSGIDYSIVKPPAIFSAFVDVIEMSKKGKLFNLGNGDKKTNPIYEGDLAKICVDAINTTNTTIEAGGKEIYTRRQLNEIVQNIVDPKKKVRNMPLGVFKVSLPLIKVFNKNMYDKFAFFTEVMNHDTIAPQIGEMKFDEYIRMKVKS